MARRFIFLCRFVDPRWLLSLDLDAKLSLKSLMLSGVLS